MNLLLEASELPKEPFQLPLAEQVSHMESLPPQQSGAVPCIYLCFSWLQKEEGFELKVLASVGHTGSETASQHGLVKLATASLHVLVSHFFVALEKLNISVPTN